VTHAEALAIAEWLLAPERRSRLARFRDQLAHWREAIGPEVWFLEEMIAKHGGMPPGDPEFTLCAQAARAYQSRGLMCPFNADDGSCEIYPVRPSPCRVTFVVDTPQFCRAGSGGLPTVVRHRKLTEVTVALRNLLKDSSVRAGYGGELALPNAVVRALDALESSGAGESL
jgi:Fe-S-cluster containining protein